MKHGPISLVEKGTLVVGILTQPDLFEKSISNMVEVKSRGAFLMGLTTYGNYSIEDTAGFTVYVPKTDPHFATSLSVIPSAVPRAWMSTNRATWQNLSRLSNFHQKAKPIFIETARSVCAQHATRRSIFVLSWMYA